MLITRDIVLAQLNAYTGKEISQAALYEWALMAAVSESFQGLAQSDSLLSATVNALMGIARKDPAHVQQIVEYYRQCLEGGTQFNPSGFNPVKSGASSGSRSASNPAEKPLTPAAMVKYFKEWKYFNDTFLTARLYVLIFAVCAFVVQVSSVINPGFMQIGLWVPSRWHALLDALPHLIYTYLVILPSPRLIQGKMYYIALPALALGAIYYCYMSFSIVSKLSLDWIFILMFLPFSAIPATLALLLLLAEKFEFTKIKD